MKNSYALLTGFVIMITFLLAGSCNRGGSSKGEEAEKGLEVENGGAVNIEISTVTRNGEKLIQMEDTVNVAIGTEITYLITDVKPGKKVTWKVKSSDGIEILEIIPVDTGGIIFKEYPTGTSNKFTLDIPDIPDSQIPEEGIQEKYLIKFLLEGDTIAYDPYLRIPPPPRP